MNSRTFRIKEIFYSLQGEGIQAGRPAVFCRYSGCNLWSGREEDRALAACRFCDTDFSGADAGVFATEAAVAEAIIGAFPPELRPAQGQGLSQSLGQRKNQGENLGESEKQGRADTRRPYIVFTGGEPALQLTSGLLALLHEQGFELGVESNGTLPLPPGLDWVCVSPKAGTKLVTTTGDELKLVWPQAGACPEDFERLAFRHFILQPCDEGTAKSTQRNMQLCIDYCLAHPRWRLGLQTHKWIGVR